MKNRAMIEMKELLTERWGSARTAEIMDSAYERLSELCNENIASPKAVKLHTEGDIFPCISLYETLQKFGIGKDEALEFLDRSWSSRAESGAESIKKILGIAGLYKLYPAIFSFVAKKQFGPAAGFEAKFYDCGRQHCKFDMTKCVYLDTCRRYGHPELTACFCHVDDVNNGNLHPRLCWNRSRYMGGGAELCDFDIFVKDKEKKEK